MSEETKDTDQIHIEKLELWAHLGVSEAERASLQRLVCNLTFWPVQPMKMLQDDLSRTVDYAAVCAETKEFVRGRSDKLIETLVDALGRHLLSLFEIEKITIELRKFVLAGTEFVSVTITRRRLEK